MKINRFLIIVCLLLCLTCLVACSRDPDGTIITTGRKPFAAPDPSNPYDDKIQWIDQFTVDRRPYMFDNKLVAVFTNTESLNNLFYDFVLEDFPGLDIKSISEDDEKDLENVRQQVLSGEEHGNFLYGIDKYTRGLVLEFNFNDYDKLAEACKLLYPRPEFRGVSPVGNGKGGSGFGFEEPNDPRYQTNQQNFADLIGLEEAWDHTTGSSSVKIGVLDSGISSTHPDLVGNLDTANGYYNTNSLLGNQFADEVGHGTSVAGIIGAVGNNVVGMSGTCWDITLVSLKVAEAFPLESGNYEIKEYVPYLVESIEYATENNIPILCFSGGWYSNEIFSIEIAELTTAITNYPGLLVCAAGQPYPEDERDEGYDLDSPTGTNVYPACIDLSNILVVGASTSNNEITDYSNYGATSVDIFAPGDNIYTTSNSGSYHAFSGTSAATPVVAGVAGLLLSYDPTLSAIEIKQAILNGADPIDDLSGLCVTGGRVNAWKPLEYIRKNYTYINNGARSNHTCKCTICNYTFNEGHSWTRGLVGFSCQYCLAISKFVEVVIPKINKRYQELLAKASLSSSDPNFYYVNIDEFNALVYDNGKYYFVYECDKNGQPLSTISTEFLADGYTIVNDKIVEVEDTSTCPIYIPSNITS